MITLRKIDNGNIGAVAALEVAPEQEWLVTSARDSFVEAWGITASGGHALPLAVYADETPVGFVFITYDGMPETWNPPIAKGNYEINHFYIAKDHQNKGYGRAAFGLIVEHIRTMPFGPAEYCWLGYKPSNKIAERLYASFGFKLTEMKNYDENIMALKL